MNLADFVPLFTNLTELYVTPKPPARWLIVLAFALVYTIWGSSYIGIHFAIQTLPPFLMTAIRFLVAGAVVIGWAKVRGAAWPTLRQWRYAAIIGALLFLVNNGGIVWAEGHGIPTGVAAVLIATLPMWMVLLTWLKPGGQYPGGMVIAGMVIGFIGIILLAHPGQGGPLNLLGVGALLIAAFAWAYGSLYAKTAPLPESATLSTGMQLVCGGSLQLVMSILTGELPRFNPAQVSTVSLLAVLYLGIVSSIIAYSAFVWLMKVCSPAKVSTYAYVNPVVAVLLGWRLAGEQITVQTVVATVIIIVSVVMINVGKGKSLARLRPAKVIEDVIPVEA
jgi:drug/metabolite transporter (DMT)-like permease